MIATAPSLPDISQINGRASPAHALTPNDLVQHLESDLQHGLAESDVVDRRNQFGWNELQEAAPTPIWRKFLAQFNAPVVWILIVAVVIAALLGEWTDALAILAIVVLNGLLGFFQEERANRALEALRKLSSPLARVYRDKELRQLPARELVPGDRIEMEAGDNVPADARLITSFSLRVQEAALTGESAPVQKDEHDTLEPATTLGDRRNMVFAGTVVAAGKASAMMVTTGMRTELGRIAGMLQHHDPESTPLQRRLAELGKILAWRDSR